MSPASRGIGEVVMTGITAMPRLECAIVGSECWFLYPVNDRMPLLPVFRALSMHVCGAEDEESQKGLRAPRVGAMEVFYLRMAVRSRA